MTFEEALLDAEARFGSRGGHMLRRGLAAADCPACPGCRARRGRPDAAARGSGRPDGQAEG